MSEDKEKAYESVCSEYRFTLENQLDAHERLRQRNTDLAKINLLGTGAILTGVSFSDLEVTLLFLAIVISISVSLFHSALILRHRSLKRGFGPSFYDSVEKDLNKENKDVWEVYKKIGKTHSESVVAVKEKFDRIEDRYQRALWTSVTSFAFLITYMILFLIPVDPRVSVEYLLLFVIPILILAVRDMVDESQ